MPNLLIQGTKDPTIANLEGWWKMDEGTSTAVADSSGNGYDCTLSNSTWVSGYNGVTYAIAPTNLNGRAVRSTASPNLSVGTNDVSYSYWLYLTGEPTGISRYVLSLLGDGFSSWFGGSVRKDGAQYKINDVIRAEGTTANCEHNVTITTGVWYHIAHTVDRTAEHTKHYQDGVYKTTVNFSSSITGKSCNSDDEVYIGGLPAGENDRHIPGYVKDVRIYNGTLLSSNEITYLYHTFR